MSEGHDERLVKIESALAHLEQLAESLNETVAGQDKALRRLTHQNGPTHRPLGGG